MRNQYTIAFTILILSFFLYSYTPSKKVQPVNAFQNIHSVEDLNESDNFSFSIISDNHGASPFNNIQMARAAKWISRSNDAFVLGVGDHMIKNENNEFLSYILRDNWWRNNFYPTIADSENDYFGRSQEDYGAGAQLLKLLGFDKKANVQMNKNSAEYYAQIKVNDVTVHYITLHYPDQPYDKQLAFRNDSKRFLIETLLKIKKQEKDIIIVSAHSMWGSWIDDLNSEEQRFVMNKCDLLLSGTTHYFERRVPTGYENRGALVINAGSVNRARFGSHNGFVKVHVMQNPFALVVQYVNTDNYNIELMSGNDSYIKFINGGVYPLEFSTLSASNYVSNTKN